jgi:hypothetical protein
VTYPADEVYPAELGDEASRAQTLDFDEDERSASAATAAPASDWYKRPYTKAEPIGPAKLPRPLYFDGAPSGLPMSAPGPDVVAIKRTLSRLGRWPWQTFDDSYWATFALGSGPNVIDSGVAGLQRQEGIQPTGQFGDQAYQAIRRALVPPGKPHAGEYGMDATAVRLLNEAAQAIADAPAATLDEVRAELAAYCRDSLANAGRIHYEQVRPIGCLGVAPSSGFTTDCSGHATCAYYWPRKVTGVAVPDPNHRGFDGYGYTGTLIDNPPAYPPYEVGDLALYGPSTSSTSHVVTCYVGGSEANALWLSHGSEDAPYSVKLRYRSDLLVVVRPPLMP